MITRPGMWPGILAQHSNLIIPVPANGFPPQRA
jgi:hypothetical protein